jgi:hypothetical protein
VSDCVRVFRVVRGSPHPASGHVDSFASLLIRPAAFADTKFLSPFPKRLKSPHNINRSPACHLNSRQFVKFVATESVFHPCPSVAKAIV